MGMYKYIRALWRRKKTPLLSFIMRFRRWKYRQENALLRLSGPSREDRAKIKGFSERDGFLFYRVRIRIHKMKKASHRGILHRKTRNRSLYSNKGGLNSRSIAEIKVAKACPSLRVYNSY